MNINILFWIKSKILFSAKLTSSIFNFFSPSFNKDGIKLIASSNSTYICFKKLDIKIKTVDINRTFNNYIYGYKKRLINLGSETYMLDKIVFNEDSIIIDCGANIGELYLYFKYIRSIKPANYFAYEPSPIEFDALSFNVHNCNNIFRKALSNKITTLDFKLIPETADSHIIDGDENYEESGVLKVDTVTLNEEIKRLKLNNMRIKLLKLEAEGAELNVLEGCLEFLKNIEFITADVSFEKKDGSSSLPEVTNLLYENNFEIIDVSASRYVLLFRNRELI